MKLSQVYDDILSNPEITAEIYDYIKTDLCEPILECACGSGDLLQLIQKDFKEAYGLDLDQEMINLAKQKGVKNLVCQSMLDLSQFNAMNTILCFGDSLNYLLDDKDVERFLNEVYNSLNLEGLFYFDMHTTDRLKEFEEEYFEEFDMGEYQYQWRILSQGEHLHHQFVFYTPHDTIVENIVQRVYSKDLILTLLKSVGFKKIDVSTDEDKEKFYVKAYKEINY